MATPRLMPIKIGSGGFTNTTNEYYLLMGIHTNAYANGDTEVQLKDSSGAVYADYDVLEGFATSGNTYPFDILRGKYTILVPPSFSLNSQAPFAAIFLVGSLEDLRGYF